MKMSTPSHMNMTMSSTMDMGDMGHKMGGMKMNMDMNMKMYFHTGFEDHILFEKWTAHTNGALFGWCVLFFVLALAYELLKYYRQLHLANASVVRVNVITENGQSVSNSAQESQNDSCQSTTSDRYERPLHPERHSRRQIPMLSFAHIIQTVLHMIQIFVSYILMLSFMLFNVWICLAVILGAGLGYFLVGSRRLATFTAFDDDHCH